MLKVLSLILVLLFFFDGIGIAQDKYTKYDHIIARASLKHGVDKDLIKAIISIESDFNHRAVSKDGDLGLMQLSPEIVQAYKLKNAFDPVENINAGAKHLKYLYTIFDNDEKVVAAYNAGETRISKGTVPKTTKVYVAVVFSLRERFRR